MAGVDRNLVRLRPGGIHVSNGRTVLAADPDGFVTEMAGYADIGVEQVFVSAPGPELAVWTARAVDVVDPLGAMVARSAG